MTEMVFWNEHYSAVCKHLGDMMWCWPGFDRGTNQIVGGVVAFLIGVALTAITEKWRRGRGRGVEGEGSPSVKEDEPSR